jgi:hypothetical protein
MFFFYVLSVRVFPPPENRNAKKNSQLELVHSHGRWGRGSSEASPSLPLTGGPGVVSGRWAPGYPQRSQSPGEAFASQVEVGV